MIPESDQVKIARIKAEERIEREKERQKSKTKREFYSLTLPMIVIFGGMLLFGIIGTIFGLK
jgi:flagellar biosynthesis/type III secretory pathway M-ring protein FliF/YscJ